MLDKSVPFYDILMHRPKGAVIKRHPLPKGCRFSLFALGDEAEWARIEASVLEFEDEIEALMYFQEERLPFLSELERRCLFVMDAKRKKIATATAWWNYTGFRRDPWLHWVAVKPEYQGLGIGRAMVGEALSLMRDIEGDRDYYLHTQTWSHRAVGLYEKAGFVITPEKNLGGYKNADYNKANEILKHIRVNGNL